MTETYDVGGFVLVVSHERDAEPVLDAAYFGPFESMDEAQVFARLYREHESIPGHENVKPTTEENEAWSKDGWTFGIFEINTNLHGGKL